MPKRTRGGTSNGARQRRAAIGPDEATPSVRKPAEAPAAPFYVAVDRQLKSGHETYEAAEKAALAIKKRYPRLLVTIYDSKTRQHTIIEPPKPAIVLNKNLAALAARDAPERGRLSLAGAKH